MSFRVVTSGKIRKHLEFFAPFLLELTNFMGDQVCLCFEIENYILGVFHLSVLYLVLINFDWHFVYHHHRYHYTQYSQFREERKTAYQGSIGNIFVIQEEGNLHPIPTREPATQVGAIWWHWGKLVIECFVTWSS